MAKRSTPKREKTMTELLKEALAESDSLRAVGRETSVAYPSLSRFLRDKQTLQLDAADRLAKFFGITSRRERQED